jgi:hypothetical protein
MTRTANSAIAVMKSTAPSQMPIPSGDRIDASITEEKRIRYRLRFREAVRDPSTTLAVLASLRMTVGGSRLP